MEFGQVTDSELNTIDFRLPAEPAENSRLIKGKKAREPKVYLGCAKWGIPEWIGKIYPPGTKERNFLTHYVQHYNSIELNTTHYKIYGPMAIAKWADKVKGKDFLFCPKMYKAVTHRGNLKNKAFLTAEFLRGIIAFGNHLGPIFIQVSDRFGPKRKVELFNYLRSLPIDLQFFVEVRHQEWFTNIEIRNELFNTLKSLKMGAVITDTAGHRECCHMVLTLPKTFIRFVGNSLHPTDYSRLDEWVERIGNWLDHGLKELYFFMHMHDEASSPELTAYLVDKLNAACNLQLQKPMTIVNSSRISKS